ncbi:MAG: hypothetical protein WA906_04580 [Pacificimonas sp.]
MRIFYRTARIRSRRINTIIMILKASIFTIMLVNLTTNRTALIAAPLQTDTATFPVL